MSAPKSCGVQYITKGCQCLTDPMDPFNPICAYVGRDNGIVYPCDPGCCQPNCGTVKGHEPRMDIEFRQTFGGTLPPGFNENLITNGDPSPTKGEAPFTPVPPQNPTVGDKARQMLTALCLILILGLIIGLKI